MNISETLMMADRAEAFMRLVREYFAGSDEVREHIVKGWDFGVRWELPNQARLSCKKGERWSCQERIEASLAYSAIAANSITDYREELMALAVIYQSCIAASLMPSEIFHKVAKFSAPNIKEMLEDFLARDEEDKSLSAFMLSAEKNANGEIEIRPSWSV